VTFLELVDKVKAATNVNCHPGASTVVLSTLKLLGMDVAGDGTIVKAEAHQWEPPQQRNVRFTGQRRRR
jgi:hypothetical protein